MCGGALALTAPVLCAHDTLVVNLSLSRQDFHIGTQDGYDVIIPKRDRMDRIGIPGHPQLPTWNPAYIIPYWKDIAYCQILALDSVQIPGIWHIYPAQVEVPIGDSAEWTPPDPAIYNSDSLYPGKLMENPASGAFDGARIINPYLYPIRYRPLSGRLFLYTRITLKLVFKDAEPPINAIQRYEHVQEIYDKMLVDLVENDADIGAWYRRPAIIDPNGGKDVLVPAYIIITTQAQANDAALGSYKEWMFQRGYVTDILTIEWILASYSGVDDADKLRECIKAYYQIGASFFLFLGDKHIEQTADIPFRILAVGNYSEYQPPSLNSLIPSDLYFENLDRNWNGDGDDFYGEPTHDAGSFDLESEVFTGRILAYTSQSPLDPNEIANWVTRVLNYEKDPRNASGLTRVFFSCGEYPQGQLGYNYYDYRDAMMAEMPGCTYDYTFSKWGTLSYINDPSHKIGWLFTYAHGDPNAAWIVDDGKFYGGNNRPGWEPNVLQMTNQNKYFIHYSIACKQNAYDDPLFGPPVVLTDTTVGEAFVEASYLGGAVASFTNTRDGHAAALIHQSVSANQQALVLHSIFSNGQWFLGAAKAEAKFLLLGDASNYDKYSLNLFGSPPTEAWTNTPVVTATTVSPNNIPVNQSSSVTVTVRYGSGFPPPVLPNARVTLYGCDIYRIGYTNDQGQVSFTITPTETGTIKVTATKHDYKPSQTNPYVGLKGGVASDVNLPTEFFMALSSSNPVKGNLKLQFGIPLEDEGLISLKIYDVSGRAVQTVFSEEKSAGYYDLSVPISSFSAGTYFLRLETTSKAKTEKIVVG